MSKLRFFWDDYAEDGTFAGLTEEYEYPASNLGHAHLSRVTKTTGDQAAEAWEVDLGSQKSFDAVVLWGHNLDGTETLLKLEATNAGWSPPGYSAAISHTDDVLVVWLGAAETYQKVRISFTKAAASDVRQAARLMVGVFYEAARNPNSIKHGWLDASSLRTAPGGESSSDEKQELRTLKLGFNRAAEAQAQEFDSMFAAKKTTRPFVISLDHATHPTDAKWLQYVRNKKEPFSDYVKWNSGAPKYNLGLDLIEAR